MRWRWEEQDFGFRFRAGSGRNSAEHYQAEVPGDFYVVPASQRKFPKARADALAAAAKPPTAPRIVPNPWADYDRDWDWIVGPDGILLNYAGCLDQEEIHRREDEGVARAMRFVTDLLAAPRACTVVRGAGAADAPRPAGRDLSVRWGLADCRACTRVMGRRNGRCRLGGIQPQMELLERDVLSRSPMISNDNDAVFGYGAEVMGECIAIHPFREGNGRTAFMLGNLILMQNDLLPLDVYDRQRDEARYFAACETARIHKDYVPLASLIEEWEDAALTRWEVTDGPV